MVKDQWLLIQKSRIRNQRRVHSYKYRRYSNQKLDNKARCKQMGKGQNWSNLLKNEIRLMWVILLFPLKRRQNSNWTLVLQIQMGILLEEKNNKALSKRKLNLRNKNQATFQNYILLCHYQDLRNRRKMSQNLQKWLKNRKKRSRGLYKQFLKNQKSSPTIWKWRRTSIQSRLHFKVYPVLLLKKFSLASNLRQFRANQSLDQHHY